jgi:hypothetical protein
MPIDLVVFVVIAGVVLFFLIRRPKPPEPPHFGA